MVRIGPEKSAYSARLSARGWGMWVQSHFGQCPNRGGAIFNGASLTTAPLLGKHLL